MAFLYYGCFGECQKLGVMGCKTNPCFRLKTRGNTTIVKFYYEQRHRSIDMTDANDKQFINVTGWLRSPNVC